MTKSSVYVAVSRFFGFFPAFVSNFLLSRVKVKLPRWGYLETACGPAFWSKATNRGEHAFWQALKVPLAGFVFAMLFLAADASAWTPTRTVNLRTDVTTCPEVSCNGNNPTWTVNPEGTCGTYCRASGDPYLASAYIVKNGDLITGIDGSKGIIVLGGNTEPVKFGIENLTISASNISVPIAIGNIHNATRATNVTMYVKGENFLVGGNGAAAIRVPLNSSLTIENGEEDPEKPAGILNAYGGLAHTKSQTVFGAGIGGGFAGNGLGSSANNPGEACGTVTINGGKINAYGGNGYGGNSAGIGGNGTSNGCTLTINGGTVFVRGGNSGMNDIANGASSTACNNGGSTTINGGSVNANVCGNATHTENTANILRKFTFNIGNSAETNNKEVLSCDFKNINCVFKSTNIAVTEYGINSVYTDANGNVYFWLPTSSTGSTPFYTESSSLLDIDNIQLKNIPIYNPESGRDELWPISYKLEKPWPETYTAHFSYGNTPPTMTVPRDYSNSLICRDNGSSEICDSQFSIPRTSGAYATGFRMRRQQHVAAVGYPVYLRLGRYIANSGNKEADGSNDRDHLVRWYRTSTLINDECDLNNAEYITTTGGPFSTEKKYTPGIGDYNKYICAAILVRDNADKPEKGVEDSDNYWLTEAATVGGNVVVYPPIKVGVVIEPVYDYASLTGAEGDPNMILMQYGLPIAREVLDPCKDNTGKEFNCSKNLAIDLDFPISVSAGIEGYSGGLEYDWRIIYGNDPTELDLGTTSLLVLDRLDKYPSGDDIKLKVTMRSDSKAKLTEIAFLRSPIKGGGEVFTARIGDDGIDTTQVKAIPKSGKIIFTFNENIGEIGTVTLKLGESSIDIVPLNAMVGTNKVEYVYGSYGDAPLKFNDLIPGEFYTIAVSGFKNSDGGTNFAFSTPMKVEVPASFDIVYNSPNTSFLAAGDMSKEFLVGDRRPVTLDYHAGDGGRLTGFCYYWEVSASNDKDGADLPNRIWGGDGTIDYPSGGDGGGVQNFRTIYCKRVTAGEQIIPVITAGPILTGAMFGHYVRLVVRPESEFSIDDAKYVDGANTYNIGEENFKGVNIKRVGIFLEADYTAGTNYEDIQFANCVATPKEGNYWTKDVAGCYTNGFVVYGDKTISLSLTTKDNPPTIYRVNGWTDYPVQNPIVSAGASVYIDYLSSPITPTVGRYLITPEVDVADPPTVAELKIGTIGGGGQRDLVTDPDYVNDALIYSNTISLTFDKTPTVFGDIMIINSDTKDTVSTTKGELICTLNLNSGRGCNIVSNTPKFNLVTGVGGFKTNYKITVSGFKAGEDRMGQESFYFTTGPGPSLVIPGFTSDLGTGEYAVGHDVNLVSAPSYVPNAGSAQGTHTYCWQSSNTQNNVTATCSQPETAFPADGFTSTAYTLVDYGKYVRLVVTPKDNAGGVGDKVTSEWMQVGVKLMMFLTENQVLGTITKSIGSESIASASDYFVAYGATRIAVSSDSPVDSFYTWNTVPSTNSGISFNNANSGSTMLTPNNPTGDITLTGTIKDVSKPAVRAELINPAKNELIFTISKAAKSYIADFIAPNGSNNIMLTATTGTGCASTGYLNGTVISLDPANSSDFAGGEWSKKFSIPVTLTAGCTYTLSIVNGAFMDTYGNLSKEETLLKNFGLDAYHKVKLSTYTIAKTSGATYGEYSSSSIGTVNVSNEGNAETLTATLENCASLPIGAASETERDCATLFTGAPASATLAVDGSVLFSVAPQLGLDAGTHTGVLRIINVGEAINQTIPITFIVDPVKVTIPAVAAAITKPYDGSLYACINPTLPTLSDASVTITSSNGGTEQSSCPSNRYGYYSDADAGVGKNVTVHYKIDGSKANNYVFDVAGGTQTYAKVETGTITPLALSVKFNGNINIGERPYNGTNTMNGSIDKNTIRGYSFEPSNAAGIYNLCLNFGAALFTLDGSNVSDNRAVTEIKNLALYACGSGTNASNYTLNSVTLAANDILVATITPIPLASLRDGVTSEYIYKSETNNCIVKSTATYGDELSGYDTEWRSSPRGSCPVISDISYLQVAGNWKLCIVPGGPGNNTPCGVLNIPWLVDENDGVVSPINIKSKGKQNIYAYFQPTGPDSVNYFPDLMVRADSGLTVLPKPISITANLDSLGDGYGKKTYNGQWTIDNVNKITPKDLVFEEDAEDIKADEAVFLKGNSLDANAEENKTLRIKWDLSASGLSEKYSISGGYTYTIGNILKKTASVNVVSIKNKYYDGSPDAEVVTGTSPSQVSGVISGDIGNVIPAWEGEQKFVFSNAFAEDNKTVTLRDPSNLKLAGSAAHNYAPILSSSETNKASIYKASLANTLCPILTSSDCNTLSKEQKDALLKADFNKGRGDSSKVVAHFMKKKNDGLGQGPIQQVYGYKFDNFRTSIPLLMPETLDELYVGLDGKGDGDGRGGTWTWENGSDYPNAGSRIGYAKFTHSSSNHETLERVPIPVDISPLELHYSISGVTRDYIPGDSTVTLKITPINMSGEGIEITQDIITGYGKMLNANAGENKNIKTVHDLKLTASPEMAGNYKFPTPLENGAINIDSAKVTINKATFTPYPAYASVTPSEFTYEKSPLSAINSILLSSGWRWEDGTQELGPTDGTPHRVGVLYDPPDMENYKSFLSYVNLDVNRRSLIDGLESASAEGRCGESSIMLRVTTENQYAWVWDGSENRGTGEANFEVTGLGYGISGVKGNKAIKYWIHAQDYDKASAEYTYTHERMLPFSKVARDIGGSASYGVSLDSSDAATKAFFGNYQWDLPKTEWYKGKTLVSKGIFLNSRPQPGDSYSLLLFTKTGEIFTSCKANGEFPEVVPVASGRVNVIASSYGSRVVAGGTSLVLNTPYGGTVSIYSMKGELLSKMKAVDARTVVKVPSAKGMYIVKLEAK